MSAHRFFLTSPPGPKLGKAQTTQAPAAPSHWGKIEMKVRGAARDETDGWLGKAPQLRQWIGAAVVHYLEA